MLYALVGSTGGHYQNGNTVVEFFRQAFLSHDDEGNPGFRSPLEKVSSAVCEETKSFLSSQTIPACINGNINLNKDKDGMYLNSMDAVLSKEFRV